MVTGSDVFLREHAFVHTEAVARAEIFNMAGHLINGMTEAERRVCPYGVNSFAWCFWHIARSEDGCVSCIAAETTQLFDEQNWEQRVGVPRRYTGSGMSKAEVAELSEAINVQELWAYRDAVGRRTRTIVSDLWPDRWKEPMTRYCQILWMTA